MTLTQARYVMPNTNNMPLDEWQYVGYIGSYKVVVEPVVVQEHPPRLNHSALKDVCQHCYTVTMKTVQPPYLQTMYNHKFYHCTGI